MAHLEQKRHTNTKQKRLEMEIPLLFGILWNASSIHTSHNTQRLFTYGVKKKNRFLHEVGKKIRMQHNTAYTHIES